LFGGCFIPVLGFVVAAIGGDVGNPLFWPFAVILGGIIGLIIGVAVYRVKQTWQTRRGK
jgi:hypothetical protein